MTLALEAASASTSLPNLTILKRPKGLSPEERQLWDVMMKLVDHNESSKLKVAAATTMTETEETDSFSSHSLFSSKELDETSLALENAKMIITSLEQASNALATDLRSKLKQKEDAIATLTAESA